MVISHSLRGTRSVRCPKRPLSFRTAPDWPARCPYSVHTEYEEIDLQCWFTADHR
jgi:hypothetical protein